MAQQYTPKNSGKSSIAQMLAQRSAPPPGPSLMARTPPPQFNGLRAPAPPPVGAAPPPPLAGATGQAILPPVLKQAMLNQIYGGGARGPSGGGVGR
jgi:hypothetical protein